LYPNKYIYTPNVEIFLLFDIIFQTIKNTITIFYLRTSVEDV